MEMQIGDLIQAIKKEGVESAQAEAERIVAEAKRRAGEIVAEAEADAAHIRAEAERESRVLKESARVAAEHAERDALLAFRNAVREEFEKLLAAEIGKALDASALAKLIEAAIGGEDPGLYAAEVHAVSEGLKSQLAEKIRGGLEIRINPRIKAGFRLVQKDGSGYFDCSDEEIARMLQPYLSSLEF